MRALLRLREATGGRKQEGRAIRNARRGVSERAAFGMLVRLIADGFHRILKPDSFRGILYYFVSASIISASASSALVRISSSVASWMGWGTRT